MKQILKNSLYPIMLVIGVIVVWENRNDDIYSSKNEFRHLFGNTMGTTYSIKHDGIVGLQGGVDSVLNDFNQALSTYLPNSDISQLNKTSILKIESPYIYPVLKSGYEIYKKTNGAFDPTIMPLASAWGFGSDVPNPPDSARVLELLKYVSMDSIYFDSTAICKLKSGMQLDFNAIAKGYGVDVIMDFLVRMGVTNALVEIGGETRALGVNVDGVIWQIGVEDPTRDVDHRAVMAVVSLNNQGLATSGNYRNFYVRDGNKYAHTIDPKTGYPVEHTLLSASVMAKSCMVADAYATAFMVMGKERSIAFIENDPELEGFLVFSNKEGELATYRSSGMMAGE